MRDNIGISLRESRIFSVKKIKKTAKNGFHAHFWFSGGKNNTDLTVSLQGSNWEPYAMDEVPSWAESESHEVHLKALPLSEQISILKILVGCYMFYCARWVTNSSELSSTPKTQQVSVFLFQAENKKWPWKPFLAVLEYFRKQKKVFTYTFFFFFHAHFYFLRALFVFFFMHGKFYFTGRNLIFPGLLYLFIKCKFLTQMPR